jgi:hypothetical protein
MPRPRHLLATLDASPGLRLDLLIVGGGDGTISQAARHVVYRGIALGVPPLGTTNNFAAPWASRCGPPPRSTCLKAGRSSTSTSATSTGSS